MAGQAHVPVLAERVTALLAPALAGPDTVLVDATLGRAGHARALLAACPGLQLIGVDADLAAIDAARDMLAPYADRVTLVHARYDQIPEIVAAWPASGPGPARVMGLLFDLGVSSPQLDDPDRGFAYAQDAPLDMRMDRTAELTAADIVNGYPAAELARVLRDYGEERFARRVARTILAARRTAPITRTGELAALVRRSVPASGTIDAATRTFQALRIAVNDELGELDRGLLAAERLLAPGGRLAVISFHSLEDRRVKSFLRGRSGHAPRSTRHLPSLREREPSFRLLTTKPVTPSPAEIARNPRARSARLRAAERIAAPAWDEAA
jgi:16S rRNA (cytosine1402-N4)-methyltransferase